MILRTVLLHFFWEQSVFRTAGCYGTSFYCITRILLLVLGLAKDEQRNFDRWFYPDTYYLAYHCESWGKAFSRSIPVDIPGSSAEAKV